MQKGQDPIQLRGYAKTAVDRGLLDDNLLDDVPQQKDPR